MNLKDDIAIKALEIRNELKSKMDFDINPIDIELDPIPPYVGSETIKLLIIGQDPTVRNFNSRRKITCTLNLDKENALKRYLNQVVTYLDLSLDNVYATNLFKYFYTIPPADTINVLEAHLAKNLELLKEEMSHFPNAKIITLGEPVFRLLTSQEKFLKDYWDYNPKTKSTDGHFTFVNTNKLGRPFFPFPHQPSLRKEFYRATLPKYLSFMKSTEFIS